jgi:hypothetical protein
VQEGDHVPEEIWLQSLECHLRHGLVRDGWTVE